MAPKAHLKQIEIQLLQPDVTQVYIPIYIQNAECSLSHIWHSKSVWQDEQDGKPEVVG